MNARVMASPARAVLTCRVEDLIAGAGVAAVIGREQVALFYLPGDEPQVFAIGNHDPIGGAPVLSRGIVGDVDGEPVVASPLYKQHFSLRTGRCLEQPEVAVPTYGALICDGHVYLVP